MDLSSGSATWLLAVSHSRDGRHSEANEWWAVLNQIRLDKPLSLLSIATEEMPCAFWSVSHGIVCCPQRTNTLFETATS